MIHQDASFRRRIIALAVLAALILLVFLVRLVQMQLLQGPHYAESSDSPAASSGSLELPDEPPGDTLVFTILPW